MLLFSVLNFFLQYFSYRCLQVRVTLLDPCAITWQAVGQCWHKSIWALVWASISRREKDCKAAAFSVGESLKNQLCTQSSLSPYHLPLSCFWIIPKGPILLAALWNGSCTFQLGENFRVELLGWRSLAVSLALCGDSHSQLWDHVVCSAVPTVACVN